MVAEQPMMSAYEVDGLDLERRTLVLEINQGVLIHLARWLHSCRDHHAESAIRAMGTVCEKSARVLHGTATAEEMDLPVFSDDDDEDEPDEIEAADDDDPSCEYCNGRGCSVCRGVTAEY